MGDESIACIIGTRGKDIPFGLAVLFGLLDQNRCPSIWPRPSWVGFYLVVTLGPTKSQRVGVPAGSIAHSYQQPEANGALGGNPTPIASICRRSQPKPGVTPTLLPPLVPYSLLLEGALEVNGGPGGETRGVATALLPGPSGCHFFLGQRKGKERKGKERAHQGRKKVTGGTSWEWSSRESIAKTLYRTKHPSKQKCRLSRKAQARVGSPLSVTMCLL